MGWLGWLLLQNFTRLWVTPVASDEPGYALMGWRYVHWFATPSPVRVNSNFEHPPLAKYLFGAAELLVGHPDITAARAVSAACTVVTSVVLAVWLGHVANRWTGLIAGLMVSALPMDIAPQMTGFGRSAFLDPVAELFMVASVVVGWFWWREGNARGWWLSAATGTLIGLATSCKENGFLGATGVILLGLAWAWTGGWSEVVRRLGQIGMAVAVAASVFVLSYVGLGDPVDRITFLIRFQWTQHDRGHLIGFAGRVSAHPPWWTNLWFAWHSLGPVVASILMLAALVAVSHRRDRVVGWCVAALGGPLVFHCLIAGNTLSFYWVMWMPAFIALSCLGLQDMAVTARNHSQMPARIALFCVLASFGTGLVVPAVAELQRVATSPAQGGRAVAALRERNGLHGTILSTGTYSSELQSDLPGVTLLSIEPVDLSGIDTILIGQPRCRTVQDPHVRALVSANLAAGRVTEIHHDSLLKIYLVIAPLQHPTPAQINRQTPGELSEHC